MIPNSRIVEKTFKGRTFQFVCVHRANPHDPSWIDPSLWSYTDEDAVREEFWNVGEGDMIFDIGAAYGSYTMAALALGASHVFAWAPQGDPASPKDQQEADFLRESAAINGWAGRCSIYEEGLYSKAGYLNVVSQEFTPNTHRTPPPNETNPDIIKVRPFGDWFDAEFLGKGFRPRGKIWVKIDTEGAEVEILKSLLRPLISPCSPNLLIENHNFKRATLEQEVRELVTSWGYHEVATRPYGTISHSFYVA